MKDKLKNWWGFTDTGIKVKLNNVASLKHQNVFLLVSHQELIKIKMIKLKSTRMFYLGCDTKCSIIVCEHIERWPKRSIYIGWSYNAVPHHWPGGKVQSLTSISRKCSFQLSTLSMPSYTFYHALYSSSSNGWFSIEN